MSDDTVRIPVNTTRNVAGQNDTDQTVVLPASTDVSAPGLREERTVDLRAHDDPTVVVPTQRAGVDDAEPDKTIVISSARSAGGAPKEPAIDLRADDDRTVALSATATWTVAPDLEPELKADVTRLIPAPSATPPAPTKKSGRLRRWLRLLMSGWLRRGWRKRRR